MENFENASQTQLQYETIESLLTKSVVTNRLVNKINSSINQSSQQFGNDNNANIISRPRKDSFMEALSFAFADVKIWKLLSSCQFILEVISSAVLVLLLSPVILFGIVLNFLLRWSIGKYFQIVHGARYHLMKPNDAFYGYEWEANPCNFTSLYILQGECSLEKIRYFLLTRWINRKDTSGEYISSRMKLGVAKKFGFYCWERLNSFDIKQHVRYLNDKVNHDKPMGEDQVFKEMHRIYDELLPEDKPRWEALVVPNYLYKDPAMKKKHYAIIFRVHHSYMDGISAAMALQSGLADPPVKTAVNPLAPVRTPAWRNLLIYVTAALISPRHLIRHLIHHDANCFHGPDLTGPKTLGWSRPVSLNALKRVKDDTKTSTTAVLTSCLGGALRNLAVLKDYPIPEQIHVVNTTAVLPYPNMKPQNRFALSLISMEIGLNGTKRRLQSVFATLQKITFAAEIIGGYHLCSFGAWWPDFICEIFMNACHGTILLSNVPGPIETAFLFGGDKLVDAVGWSPVKNKIGIATCLFSYAGKVRAAVVADSAVLSAPTDVTNLIMEFEREVKTVCQMSGVPLQDCFPESKSPKLSQDLLRHR